MEIEFTRISSKGQIVIPLDIRNKMKISDGETFAVSAQDNLIVLKKVDNPMEEEDLNTLREIEEAWKEIGEGKFKKMKSDDFLKEISKW